MSNIEQLAQEADAAMAAYRAAYLASINLPKNIGSLERVKLDIAYTAADNARYAADARLKQALIDVGPSEIDRRTNGARECGCEGDRKDANNGGENEI